MEDRVDSSDGVPVVTETTTEPQPQGDRLGMEGDKLGMEDDVGVTGDDRAGMEDVASQLSQLQCLAREMKTGFSQAMEALQDIQYGDQNLEATVQHNKAECEQQLGDIVHMVLALKSEFGGVVAQLKLATETQQTLQRHVDLLQCERDILLEELERSGSISSQLRQKYHSGQDRPNGLNRSSDSTSLSALLERARNTFNTSGHHSSNSSSQLTSDHDSGVMNTYQPGGGDMSCDDVTPPIMSPIVQSYIAGLQDSDQVEDIPLDENYDSDSSLTATINKSLDLGRSLSEKCTELTKMDLSDDEMEDNQEGEEMKGEGEGEGEEERCKGNIQLARLPSDEQPSAHSSPLKMFSPRRVPPHERNARETQRLRVAREILETERKYCSALWTILDHFAGSLKQLGIVPLKDISTMFPGCLSVIYEQHCHFLQTLEDRLLTWQWQCVLGDVFARFSDTSECDLLQHYQTYVNEFPAALHQIRKSCSNSRRFKQFIKMSQRAACCDGLDIGAFLLTPIQRIPRYVLLLKQLLKYTDKGHPDCYYIDLSLQKLGGFLSQLNDSIQYSVQMVTSEATPKPKRRLWLGSSFRSSVSSHDGDLTLSSCTKDSGMHSGHDDDPFTGSDANGRLFQFGQSRDALTKLKLNSLSRRSDSPGVADQPVVLGQPALSGQPILSGHAVLSDIRSPLTGSKVTGPTPPQVASPFTFKVPASPSFNERWSQQKSCDSQSITKPERKTKLRQKQRPKTTEIHFNPTLDYAPSGSVTKSQSRLGSEVNASSNGDVQKPNVSCGALTFTSPPSDGLDRRLRVQLVSHDHVDRSESVTLDRGVSRSTQGREVFSSYTIPRVTSKDYGIYGDDDAVDDDDDVDDTDPQVSPRDSPLTMSQRCFSQGNINVKCSEVVSATNPPQGVINKSLAKSLIDVNRDMFCTTSADHQMTPRLGQQQQQMSESVWSESSLADVSSMTVASVGGGMNDRKKGVKKRKKEKKASADEMLKKRGSLKDSLRNIFFKKSKVVKRSASVQENTRVDRSSPSASLQSSQSASPTSTPRGSALYKIKEQEPPLDNSVSLPQVIERRPDLELVTFEDENGDPCSAV